MSDSKKRLVDFEEPTERPSVKFIRENIEKNINGDMPSPADAKNILDGYEDLDYAPSISQVQEWVDRETEAMRQVLDANVATAIASLEDSSSDLLQEFNASLDASSKSDVDNAEMEQAFAKLISFMDRSAFWGGTPLEDYWHASKAQSALLKIHEKASGMVDALTLPYLSLLDHQRILAEAAQQGGVGNLDLNEMKETGARHQKNMKAALGSINEIIELAIKTGFLYRDSWWLEEHGDAALKGYVAKETSTKAGVGGSVASNSARMKRLRCFLKAHAIMMRENRAMVDLPSEVVAFNALKLARKVDPKIFKIANSQKLAIQYWEYVKSDTELWAEYQRILFNKNGLRE